MMENIIDYEKKYKKALERAREELGSGCYNKGTIEYIFPELKESEDEMIRGAIIDHLKDHNLIEWAAWLEKQDKENNTYVINNTPNCGISVYNEELKESEGERIRKKLIEFFKDWGKTCSYYCWNIPIPDILAWLEKQDETFTKKDIDDAYIEGMALAKHELEKQSEQKDTLCDKCKKEQPSHSCQDITALGRCAVEKQDEQKPIDKIEPKFHVGDWIVNRGHSYLIADIDYSEQRYLFEIGGYTHEQLNWEYIELADKRYHLWTLEDAKDGDVLSWDDSKCIALFKNIYDEDSFNSHGFVGHWTNIFESRLAYHDIEGAHPATKEQRDLLFAKMHEAGYEWNEEKKELKLLITNGGDFCESENCDGENCGIDSLFHAKRILEKTLGKVDGYQSDDGIFEHECAIEAVNKLYKQKPVWSEDDRIMAFTLMRDVDQMSYVTKEGKNERIRWLNSLDEKFVSTKSAWSEEDETGWTNTMIMIKEVASKHYTKDSIKLVIDWLNSLKERMGE